MTKFTGGKTMYIERGSMWRKWDFHVHTPFSLLNNNFGFNPDTEMNEENFDTYVRTLFGKALDNNIAAIGITDYFSIEGYKLLHCNYLNNEQKMLELFPDEAQRNKVKQIYVFPNIELRLDTFVGRNSHSVNYHVIFSDKVPIDDIEQNFLHNLQLTYQASSTLSLTRNNIERLGHEYKQFNTATGSDYLIGLERATVSHSNVLDVLSSPIFKDKYIITISVDEDLSEINWSGRDYETRKVLYQQCHCLLSSNEKTRQFALAKGHEEEQIREFGSIKPCIWGSDAHSYESMFLPANNRFCWIKAEASFDGLQQILYEPEERVRIQEFCPDEKDPHQTIDYIQFDDERIQADPIYLSDGLTCIIGGKSTGKSILLRHIALSASRDQVEETLKKEQLVSSSKGYLSANANVVWKDGTSSERKIVYIPQSWLNRVVEVKTDDSDLNELLSDILLQHADVLKAKEVLDSSTKVALENVEHAIDEYVNALKQIELCDKDLLEKGKSETFESTIAQLTEQREVLSNEVGITPEMLQRYATLEQNIRDNLASAKRFRAELGVLEIATHPTLYIHPFSNIDSEQQVTYSFEHVPTVSETLQRTIQSINETIEKTWNQSLETAKTTVQQSLEDLSTSFDTLTNEHEPIKQRIALNERLNKIDEQLSIEKARCEHSKEIERTKIEYQKKSRILQNEIMGLHSYLHQAYSAFCDTVNGINRDDTSLEFHASASLKNEKLFDSITALFDKRGFRVFREKTGYSLSDIEDFKIDDKLFLSIWSAMEKGLLAFKGGNDIEVALKRLFTDWYHVHYTVKSGEDTINSMSPGKKALVLLELIINIEKGNYPILIDQPEDDLDNRSIYSDLVQYLRQKKHERQIIVVTHNANVVIGADAEEVIIANQNGKESANRSRRFEYSCGSLENSRPLYDENGNILAGILNQKGIQEQICDILEGGKKAFELRKSKYFNL